MKKTKKTIIITVSSLIVGLVIALVLLQFKGNQAPSVSAPVDQESEVPESVPESVKDAIFIDDQKDEIPAEATEAAKKADEAAREALSDQSSEQEDMKAKKEEEKKAAEEAKNLTKEAAKEAKEAEEEEVKDQSPSESTPESTPNSGSGEVQGDPIPTPEVEAGEADDYSEEDYVPGTPDPEFVDPYAGDPNVISGTLDWGNSDIQQNDWDSYVPSIDMSDWDL